MLSAMLWRLQLGRWGISILPPRRQLAQSPLALEHEAYKSLAGPCRIQPGSRLILCISGGSDSMSLLHLVMASREKFQPALSVEVLHFNHKLREESEEEASFVGDAAAACGAPFHLREWTGPALSTGMHDAARRWRQEQSLQIARRGPSAVESLVCTAHQREDQTETILMKLIRGVHLSRLQMMKPRDGPFVKPLLSMQKEQLTQYLTQHGHAWREDSSNADRKYQRNRVRLDLIPLMANLAGGQNALYRRCSALSEQSAQLQQWIKSEVHPADERLPHSYVFATPWIAEKRTLQLWANIDGEGKRFSELPSLVQGDIMYNFLTIGTETQPDYLTVRRVLGLVRPSDGDSSTQYISGVPKGALVNKRITLTDVWEVKREKCALVISRRSDERH